MPDTPLTEAQRKNVEELMAKPENEIDTLPESAVRGTFYRPIKQAVSLRLDADVLAGLKKDGQG